MLDTSAQTQLGVPKEVETAEKSWEKSWETDPVLEIEPGPKSPSVLRENPIELLRVEGRKAGDGESGFADSEKK